MYGGRRGEGTSEFQCIDGSNDVYACTTRKEETNDDAQKTKQRTRDEPKPQRGLLERVDSAWRPAPAYGAAVAGPGVPAPKPCF